MARKLSELIKKENVVFLESIEINETLDLLIEKGVEIGKIKDSNIFKESVLEREKLVSTGIGHGIAMPHTKSSQVEDFFIIVGLNKNGIDYVPYNFMELNKLYNKMTKKMVSYL